MSQTGLSLGGKRILVTRPAGQSDRLAARIREAGGEPVLFPAIDILPPRNLQAVHRLIDELEHFDLALFISPTAVEQALALIRHRRTWPDHPAVACIGQGSARALNAHGFHSVIAPQSGADSEALLELPEMQQVAGKRIVIFRGEGGREMLAEALKKRGAETVYAECYRRARPQTPFTPLLNQGLSAVTLSSKEALDNLFELTNEAGRERLRHIPLFVPHPRIADAARQHGFQTVLIVAAGDAGMLEGMVKFFQS